MSRARFLLLGMLVLLILAPAIRADDEPMFRDKPLSAWMEILRGDKEVKRRQGAVIALERIGPAKSNKVLPALVTALRDPDQDATVRAAAAAALGRLYETYKVVAEEMKIRLDDMRDGLIEAVRTDKAPAVREAAVTALGQMEGASRYVVPTLAAALKDDEPLVRAAAAESLRRQALTKDGLKDVTAVLPDLQRLLADKTADHAARSRVARTIGLIGPPDGVPAVPALTEALADAKSPDDLRLAAAETLGRFGKDAATAAGPLGAALTDKDAPRELRRAAVEALDRLGPDAKAALAVLEKIAIDDDKYIKVVALHALGRIGAEGGADAKGVVAVLLPRLNDDVIDVRVAAIQALGGMGAEALGADLDAVKGRLKEQAGDSRAEIRDAATAALDKLKTKP